MLMTITCHERGYLHTSLIPQLNPTPIPLVAGDSTWNIDSIPRSMLLWCLPYNVSHNLSQKKQNLSQKKQNLSQKKQFRNTSYETFGASCVRSTTCTSDDLTTQFSCGNFKVAKCRFYIRRFHMHRLKSAITEIYQCLWRHSFTGAYWFQLPIHAHRGGLFGQAFYHVCCQRRFCDIFQKAPFGSETRSHSTAGS